MEVDGEGLLGQETPATGPHTPCIGGCFWSLSQPHLGFPKSRRLPVVIALLCKCCAESSLRDTGTQGHRDTGTMLRSLQWHSSLLGSISQSTEALACLSSSRSCYIKHTAIVLEAWWLLNVG